MRASGLSIRNRELVETGDSRFALIPPETSQLLFASTMAPLRVILGCHPLHGLFLLLAVEPGVALRPTSDFMLVALLLKLRTQPADP